jgi:hypothetical protein
MPPAVLRINVISSWARISWFDTAQGDMLAWMKFSLIFFKLIFVVYFLGLTIVLCCGLIILLN